MQQNHWDHTTTPGTPTFWCFSSSVAIRPLWAAEELIEKKKLDQYEIKTSARARETPKEMRDLNIIGKSPIMTVSPASAPDKSPAIFAESRLVVQFLADYYSDGIWEPDTPEDKSRDIYFQEFGCNSIQGAMNMIIAVDILPRMVPWPFKPIFALFIGWAYFLTTRLPCYFELMEASLSEEKPWFSGAKLGQADFCMVFSIDVAVQRSYIQLGKYPKISQWHQRVLDLPSYQRAMVKMGGYNLKNFT